MTTSELASMIPARERDGRSVAALARATRRMIREGNFTAVIFMGGRGVVVGVSKRNPCDDPDDPARGERIATVRAYRAYREGGWR